MAIDFEVLPIVAIVLLVILGWRWLLHFARRARALPRELRGAPVIFAERLFRTSGQVSITAKVDRVYRNRAGKLVLLELKTRWVHRAFFSDVIELSAQRLAITVQTGMPVAGHAYVLTVSPDERRSVWHRVQLLNSAAVTALAFRREALLVGATIPHCAKSPRVCRECGFLPECE